MNRIICERQRKKKLENDATRKDYTFQCIYCGKPYVISLTERDLKKFNEGKKGYRRCCKECWHSVGGKAAAKIRKTNSINK